MISEKKAFTLIEILATIAIFSVLAAGAMWFVVGSSRDASVIWEQLVTQNQGKKTIGQVTDYIRKAETSSGGAYALQTAGPYDLVFYANIDSDSLVEKIEFSLGVDNILRQTITKPSSTIAFDIYDNGTSQVTDLADNVINFTEQVPVPIFLYYGTNFTGTEPDLGTDFNLTDVRMVKVQLELEKDPTKSPVPLYVESTALIRSTKTN